MLATDAHLLRLDEREAGMTVTTYQPDLPADATDLMILVQSGPEPSFDPVMTDFMMEGYRGLKEKCAGGGLLSIASLGLKNPWVYRLTFRTRGLTRGADGQMGETDRHVVALRFLPDYLRTADRFNMLRLVEPADCWHPNIIPNRPDAIGAGAICVEVYAGESLLEICPALHDLFRWRLRQYDERDSLNKQAAQWGRENVDRPIDDRPLFGAQLKLQWQASAPS
jgi:hypothetical protein